MLFRIPKTIGIGLLSTSLLYGCSTPGEGVRFNRDISIKTMEDTPPSGHSVEIPSPDDTPPVRRPAEFIDGSGVFLSEQKTVKSVVQRRDGSVSMTFKNTDIRIVLRAVLTDVLKISYSVDPRVQGNVTLETGGNVSKHVLRMSLEALLKTQGYALVSSSDGYLVLPIEEAPRNVETIGQRPPASSSLPGFGVQVVSLRYTVPSEMQKLIEPFAPASGILAVNDARQILILAGTEQELAGMLRAVRTFDVDTMKGMSYAIYSLQYVEPEAILEELKELFQSGEENSIVKFISVPRLNRIIAISANKEVLRSVEIWVSKLDLGGSSPGRRIYVYQVKNGRAVDMAETINTILGSRGSYGQSGYGRSAQSRNSRSNSSNFSNNQPQRSRSQSNTGFGNSNDMLGDEVRIVPSEENNSIVIMATPSEFGTIEAALKQIDVPPRQVLIEVTLAEVGLTDELRYGLQWQFDFSNNAVAFGRSASPSPEFPGFSWVYAKGNTSAVLNAIESVTDVKVVSSPKILVLNNESATLQVGDEVPVPTTSSQSTSDSNAPIVNSIQYRNTGIILTVTPRINDSGLVMLDIEQEMSDVVETASSGIDAPTIQQRKISSSIAVQNGSTIALGGLIRNSASKVRSGIPLLKDLPLLGNVFRSNDLVERRTEFVVLLTPRIIRNVGETRAVMDRLRTEFEALMAEPPIDSAVEPGAGQSATRDP